jgi:hypothetical protein
MSEWWTYRLSSFLLFSPRTYFRLHELYNLEIWPTQLLALGLGTAIVVLTRRSGTWPGRGIALILALCWIWVAWAFHLRRYATINWAATYFAAAFAIEALLLAWTGVALGRLRFSAKRLLPQRAGLYIFLFALVAQPAIGHFVGRGWSQVEFFGVAPDPTVVATLGIVLLADNRVHWGLLVVPLLWCAMSGALQWALGSPDALVTPLMGLLAVIARVTARPRSPPRCGPRSA